MLEVPSSRGYLAIHYSCGLARDYPRGTPPISNIVVQDLYDDGTIPFGVHIIAERKGISLKEMEHSPELEELLLREFFNFVRRYHATNWIHWGMNKPTFGFPHLAHRMSIYNGDPLEIPPEQRIDLAATLARSHGNDYIDHPRLFKLIEANGLNDHGLLSAEQAAAAWAMGDYSRLLESTRRKVDSISQLYRRYRNGELVTKHGKVGLSSGPKVIPEEYLWSWKEILGCVGLDCNPTSQRRVAEANERYRGPINPPVKGGQPMVVKRKLLDWWNDLERLHTQYQQEQASKTATVADRHNYGKHGIVVPAISGSVRKRRNQRPPG